MDTVKYHNDLNNLNTNEMNDRELNLFVSVLFKSKNNNSSKLEIPFNELLFLEKSKSRSHKRLVNSILNMNEKLIKLNKTIKTDRGYLTFNLFNDFEIFEDTKILEISINEKFRYLLNEFIDQFTVFELNEFIDLKSIYSKRIFKILKQFEGGKNNYNPWHKIEIEKFKDNIGIPSSYDTKKVNEKILKPIKNELSKILNNFKIEKLTKSGEIAGRGKKAYWIKFSWSKKQIKEPIEAETIEETSHNILKAVLDAKKNIYVSKAWDKRADSKIDTLVKKHGEEFVIKVLKGICSDLKTEVKTTLVQYLNGAVKNILDGEQIEHEKKEKKVERTNKVDTRKALELKLEDIKEPVKYNLDLDSQEVKEAMKKCSDDEGVDIKTLEEMKKKSKSIFIATIKKYL